MYEFECWHENSYGEKWAIQKYIAETPAKAKAKHFNYLQDGLWEDSFFVVVKDMKCKKLGKASARAFFGNIEIFERMKELRGIEFAFMGMRIQVCDRKGIIVGSNSSLNLNVVFDGTWYSDNCHPWYETIYYDNDGNIIADYRKNKLTSVS